MNLKITLAAGVVLCAVNVTAQENILDMRENYTIGQNVTVSGVITSDDNLGQCDTCKMPRQALPFILERIGPVGKPRRKSVTAYLSLEQSLNTMDYSKLGQTLRQWNFSAREYCPNPWR